MAKKEKKPVRIYVGIRDKEKEKRPAMEDR